MNMSDTSRILPDLNISTVCLCVDKRISNEKIILEKFSELSPKIFLAGSGKLPRSYGHIDVPLPRNHKGQFGPWLTRPGSYNAFLCFKTIIEGAKFEGRDALFLLEDDARPASPFGSRFPKEVVLDRIDELTHIDPSWEALYFGANHTDSVSQMVSPRLLRTFGCTCFHGILLRKNIFDKVLNLPLINPIDNVFQRFHRDGHCYAVWPNIIVTEPGYSCVEGREVNYLPLFEKLGRIIP